MTHHNQHQKIANGKGFIAALDQSGGSTPKALKQYGIDEGAYSGEEEMFRLVHEMRTRIITAPAFTGDKIIGAILFEKTMNDRVEDLPTAQYLWEKLEIVPFLKIDKGLAGEEDGVQVMKPMPGLGEMLERAKQAGIFGTKMRSVIHSPSTSGIAAVVEQQFEVAHIVLKHGLVPIIEPEINIKAPEKAACEDILKTEILKLLRTVPEGKQVIFKLTLPETGDFYSALIEHENTMRVVALSGGYDLEEACRRLSQNNGMIASFSRALTSGLHVSQSDEEFNATLQHAIDEIYTASVGQNAETQAA